MMLHQLALAYHNGDIATLIRLVQSDTIDAVHAHAQVQLMQRQQERQQHASYVKSRARHMHAQLHSCAA